MCDEEQVGLRAEHNIEADVGSWAEAQRATVIDTRDPRIRGRAVSIVASRARAPSSGPGEPHPDVEPCDTGQVAAVPAWVGVGKVTFEAGAACTVDSLVCVGLADDDTGGPVFSDAAGCALALYEPWAGVGHAIGRVLDDRPDRHATVVGERYSVVRSNASRSSERSSNKDESFPKHIGSSCFRKSEK